MQNAYVSAQSYEKYAYPTPYFTIFLPSERLILQFLRLQNALFYKFLPFRTPYFTVFASFLMAFQFIIEPFGCLEVVLVGA